MSAKTTADKKKDDYPWTARQRRAKTDKRLVRKQLRKRTRNR